MRNVLFAALAELSTIMAVPLVAASHHPIG